MLILIIVLFLVNSFYWLMLFSRFSFYKEPEPDTAITHRMTEEVLVTLCIRNEASTIERLVCQLMDQDYPNYSVLIIDDCSTDETLKILKKLQYKYGEDQIQIIYNDQHKGKKQSIHDALMQIDVPILLFTDGDCQLASKQWISGMCSKLKGETELVLAYGPFHKRSSMLNLFARFECSLTAIQYFSYALAGIPYMGVGRNLAYRKSLFDKQNGYAAHLDIQSGDDDLFINAVASPENTTIQINPSTFVYSEAAKNWKAFFRQKKRHISTATSYKAVHKYLLSFFAGSQVLIYLLAPIAGWQWFLIAWLIRMVILLPIAARSLNKLKELDLIWYLPLLDLMLSLYYLVMAIWGLFPSKNKW